MYYIIQTTCPDELWDESVLFVKEQSLDKALEMAQSFVSTDLGFKVVCADTDEVIQDFPPA